MQVQESEEPAITRAMTAFLENGVIGNYGVPVDEVADKPTFEEHVNVLGRWAGLSRAQAGQCLQRTLCACYPIGDAKTVPMDAHCTRGNWGMHTYRRAWLACPLRDLLSL